MKKRESNIKIRTNERENSCEYLNKYSNENENERNSEMEMVEIESDDVSPTDSL